MGKFIITESERTDIMRQYNLILEQDDKPRESLVIDKVVTFPAGYYSEKYLKDLIPEVEKITQYLKSGKSGAFLVEVEMSSGESQIPNSDVETKNPEGTTQGWLAQQRQTTITQYITDQLQGFVDQKLLLSLPKFVVNPITIGETPWVGQTFIQPNGQKYVCTEKERLTGCIAKYRACKTSTCKDLASKYSSEQYIKVKITLKELTTQKKCLDNMVIEVNYLKGNHHCNSSVFKISINNIFLNREDGQPFASLNNDVTKDKKLNNYNNNPTQDNGPRYNKFIVTPDIANQLLMGGTNSFTINATCWNPTDYNHPQWGLGCHDGVGDVIITNGKGQKSSFISSTPKGRNQTKTLVTINACGSGKGKDKK
jgi:hypothetical protein